MRRFPIFLCLSAALVYAAARRGAPRAEVITTAQRAAALHKVDSWLRSSASIVFDQPAALVPFFERLYQMETNPSRSSVHVLHFGDSHTAADEWTAGLREFFQHRFGNGGSGFSVAGYPFKGYRRLDARGGASPGWLSEGLRSAAGDGYFGLGGISISSERAGQSVYLDTDCDRIEIQYLQHPGGGSLALYDNGLRIQQFSTYGELAPAFVTYETAPGPHHFVLQTLDSRLVRLFGWVVDKPIGVTYEALGINGAEASVMLRWNEAMLASYVQRRNPGLIVLAYGTNEASDPNWMPETYQAAFATLIARLRNAVPAATILVAGPGDRWAHYPSGWRAVAGIDSVIDAQRIVCQASGCAFWDLRRRMGGKGAMREWVMAGLGQPDRVHFTAVGYQRLAAVLFDDLISQYEIYKKARVELDQRHGQTEQDH